jgi:hypothetical protein
MRTVTDCFGRAVRLTDARLAHILEHPEMLAMEEPIVKALQQPAEVRLSQSDDTVRLFYQFHETTPFGGKWLCVVVKYLLDDAFIITAYLTDKVKAGEALWPKE